jgi:hypothetical protein
MTGLRTPKNSLSVNAMDAPCVDMVSGLNYMIFPASLSNPPGSALKEIRKFKT